MELKDEFRSAGRNGIEFRGAPFWSWNDALEPGELRRQVREMARVGLGGHFMHARAGLITEYMGDHWMRCVGETIAESKKQGIKAWLYDEDTWPSGFAGGAVRAKGREYWAKYLLMESVAPGDLQLKEHSLALFAARKTEAGLTDFRRISHDQATTTTADAILHIYWDTGYYVDLLSEKVVRTFLDEQYEPYRREFKEHFGKTIPGVFTDEPAFVEYGIDGLPYTDGFFDRFAEKWGYDVRDFLPLLFFNDGDYRKVRYHYWRLATEMFVNAFSRQIYQWCDENNLQFTGHYLFEDNIRFQVGRLGAVMPHYEFQHIPGIDLLTRGLGEPLLCKQVSSVAHQMGERRVVSEMYGCCGWNVSFEELKWIGEWQYVQGVNLPCQHLELYSAKGCRKRDYPPSLYYQQPWWSDYRLFNDYFARQLFMLTRGTRAVDILVLHTIESAWTEFVPPATTPVDELNDELTSLTNSLLRMHRDFDFGDETILSRHGKIAGQEFKVAKAAYQVVIVPRCITIRSTTLRLLEEFAAEGGTLLMLGPPPERVDGVQSDVATALWKRAPRVAPKTAAIAKALDAALPRSISVADSRGREIPHIYVQQRHLQEGELFFLVNIDPENSADADVHIPVRGRVEKFDCNSGEVRPLSCTASQDGVSLNLHFAAKGSHLLLVRRGARPVTRKARPRVAVATKHLADRWKMHREEHNALTLDYCRYRIGEGNWSLRMPVIDVQHELNKLDSEVSVQLEFTFESRLDLSHPHDVSLVMEEPDQYEITVNGRLGPKPTRQWWRDIAFRKMDISTLLQPGPNTILLRRNFLPTAVRHERMQSAKGDMARWLKHGVEFESIYIVGDFAVESAGTFSDLDRHAVKTDGPFMLVTDAASATTGDLTPQGLPFFAGKVTLSQSIELNKDFLRRGHRIFIEMEHPDAIVTGVAVNGTSAGKLIWAPFELDVTDLLHAGANHIEIELTGSCRNLLGPHHHANGELHSVSPGSFERCRSADNGQDDDWRDHYCFVKFGLKSAPRLRADAYRN
jgi:hypothetical protein